MVTDDLQRLRDAAWEEFLKIGGTWESWKYTTYVTPTQGYYAGQVAAYDAAIVLLERPPGEYP